MIDEESWAYFISNLYGVMVLIRLGLIIKPPVRNESAVSVIVEHFRMWDRENAQWKTLGELAVEIIPELLDDLVEIDEEELKFYKATL